MQNTTYKNLLSTIKDDLSVASLKSVETLRYQKVLSNWRIGQSIEEYVKSSAMERGDRTKIVDRLIHDLKLHKRFIQDVCKFYRLYLKAPKTKAITWSHYQHLLSVSDPSLRRYWEDRIIKENLGIQKLECLLYENRKQQEQKVEVIDDQLQFILGELYVYRVLKINYAQNRGSQMVIDCGFYIDVSQKMNDALHLQGGYLIKSIKRADGYTINRCRNDNREKLYTYQAAIKRVVDGDTLSAHIDVGFGIRINKKLRLRGIDTPELGTPRGIKAKEIVENKLKDCRNIVIKSYGNDLHGRTVADVFYDPNSDDLQNIAKTGKYLNQELLDEGLANLA